ncbi:metal-dependent hydrolase family protein [Ovoidimarina sediminis]|uniref:metal-dependent hydrolase family protein n=1 Tax=Ovoidimarina sediminis TaxID=3079856 RepID=UPI00290742E0|nr:amidohydrolase family protein [Rhodophyticola sp. MJ-SS7]MDU8944262.1 amidohydrolase family protein [Rhodophyticola sp. MJ-SS7]
MQLKLSSKILLAASASVMMAGMAIAQSSIEIPPVTLIKNVHVWDGTSDNLQEDTDVLIVGDKIRRVAKDIPASGTYKVSGVRKTAELVPDAPGFEGKGYNLFVSGEDGSVEEIEVEVSVIDGKGGYLIPGLIDSHQHIMLSKGTGPQDILNNQLPYTPAYNAIPQGHIMLDMGITTIRDTGGNSVELGMAIDQDFVDGPRIYSSGAGISITSGHADFGGLAPGQGEIYPGSTAHWSRTLNFMQLADGVPEVRKATRWALAQGAKQIKMMAGGGVASLKDPLESVGYSEAEMRAMVEAATDYDTYVMAHAYNDESVRRAIRAGVKDIVHGHLLSEETVKMMAENDVWLGSLSKPFGLMEVPWFTEENRRKGRLVLEGYENVMTWAKKYGVKMGWGTDAAAGMVETITYEFQSRAPFFTPLEQLKQATSTNAELLRFSNSRDPYKEAPLGVIEEGAWADMLIYNKNPLEDIMVAAEPKDTLKVVIKGGKVWKNEL